MDRFFLAIICAGLLLAATATSLLVAIEGGRSVAVLSPPQAPAMPSNKMRLRRTEENRSMPQSDSAE